MPDIRDILKGLSVDDRAVYQETRTAMRRAYLAAHAAILPINEYSHEDDAFLDLIDIKIATLFDRAGVFNHAEGHVDKDAEARIEKETKVEAESAATRMMKQSLNQPYTGGWTSKPQ